MDVPVRRSTYLNIAADRVHPFIVTVFVLSYSSITLPDTLQTLHRKDSRNMERVDGADQMVKGRISGKLAPHA